MDKESRGALGRLHQELTQAPQLDSHTRQLLGGLLTEGRQLTDVEKHRLEAAAVEFEASHPKLASSMRELIDLLVRAGV